MIFFSGRLGSSELLMNRYCWWIERRRPNANGYHPKANSQEPKSPEAFFTKC